jgi:hypothetical protein
VIYIHTTSLQITKEVLLKPPTTESVFQYAAKRLRSLGRALPERNAFLHASVRVHSPVKNESRNNATKSRKAEVPVFHPEQPASTEAKKDPVEAALSFNWNTPMSALPSPKPPKKKSVPADAESVHKANGMDLRDIAFLQASMRRNLLQHSRYNSTLSKKPSSDSNSEHGTSGANGATSSSSSGTDGGTVSSVATGANAGTSATNSGAVTPSGHTDNANTQSDSLRKSIISVNDDNEKEKEKNKGQDKDKNKPVQEKGKVVDKGKDPDKGKVADKGKDPKQNKSDNNNKTPSTDNTKSNDRNSMKSSATGDGVGANKGADAKKDDKQKAVKGDKDKEAESKTKEAENKSKTGTGKSEDSKSRKTTTKPDIKAEEASTKGAGKDSSKVDKAAADKQKGKK